MNKNIGKVWVKDGLDAILDFVNLLDTNEEEPELRVGILNFLSSNEEYKDFFIHDSEHNIDTIIRVCTPHTIIVAENEEVLEAYYDAKKEGIL